MRTLLDPVGRQRMRLEMRPLTRPPTGWATRRPRHRRRLLRLRSRRWTRPRFSSYDKHVVTDEQIQKWADEAEAGYDVDELKRRGRGRPGRGAEPMQVVAVRLTAEELAALDAAAAQNDMSRSELIRAALAHFAA
jgi:hypothetical protein